MSLCIYNYMIEKEVQGKTQIYHIIVSYKEPIFSGRIKRTGHMVMAKTPKLALEIANKHHIGNPMRKDKENIKHRKLMFKEPVLKNYCMKHKSNIWYENKNCDLRGIKTKLHFK